MSPDNPSMLVGNQLTLARTDKPDLKTREVRLGLVLYGGVSLAVYIHGVVREFFRAVHGEGVYRLIKALTDSDVVVDVISGTSAGGVNGILLSYALCNKKDFASCADLWRLHGGILDLLRSPHVSPAEAVSLLNSEGYYQPWLEKAFAEMDLYKNDNGDGESRFNELDLFITGTDVDGNIYTEFDDAGHQIDVKNHRSVFELKFRDGRKNNFKDDKDPAAVCAALAKLARITSCFPVAFAPVLVKRTAPEGDDAEKDYSEETAGFAALAKLKQVTSDVLAAVGLGQGDKDAKIDSKLQLWGAIGKEACFLDGGILDNKPFTYTIKAIFGRTADRDVKRTLFFVEPDPEQFPVPTAETKATQPNILQAVLASLLIIPGYESISNDLKLLADHNSKVQQYKRLVERIDKLPTAKGRSEATAQELYLRTRIGTFSQRVIQAVFRKDGRGELIAPGERETALRIVTGIDELFDNLTVERAAQLFEELDFYYRLRRLYRVVYLIIHKLYEETPTDADALMASGLPERYLGLWQAFNRQIKLYEVVRTAVEKLLDDAPFPWKTAAPASVWLMVEAAVYRLFKPGSDAADVIDKLELAAFLQVEHRQWLPQPTLDRLNAELKKACRSIYDEVKAGTFAPVLPANTRTVLMDWDDNERAILAHFLPDANNPVLPESNNEIVQAYCRFADLDRSMYPLEMVSGLGEKDIIETIRVSPRDAQKGFSKLEDGDGFIGKVAGTGLHYFGGFFKRSWRSNDILWGRLDGLCQLVESLLDSKRLTQIASHDAYRKRIRTRFFENADAAKPFQKSLDPETLFPKAGKNTHEELRGWLRLLLSDDKGDRDKALQKFPPMQELLIQAAQLEIVAQEVPRVIGDAINEQSSWNRYQVMDRPTKPSTKQCDEPAPVLRGPLPWVFETPGGVLDPLVMATVADQARKDLEKEDPNAEPPKNPMATRFGAFFHSWYKVGLEKWDRDIPTVVMLEVLATAMLVLRTCILGMLGEDAASRVRGSPLYKFGLDYPLRAFYAVVVLARRDPLWLLALFFGAGLLSAFALVVGITWHEAILFPQGNLELTWLIVFILVPCGVLLGELLFLVGVEGRVGWRAACAFAFVALAAAAALYVGHFGWPAWTGLTYLPDNTRWVVWLIAFLVVMVQGTIVFWLGALWSSRILRRRNSR